MDIIIFCYSGDAALLPMCVSHASAHGHVIVADDAAAPATDAAGARAMGAHEYVRTTFDRGGNLNGSACVRGMLETMLEHGCDDWIMQVDCDTLLFRADVLFSGVPDHVTLVGTARGHCDAVDQGNPYHSANGTGLAIRRRMLPRMLELARRDDIARRIDAGPGYSDHVLYYLHSMSGGTPELLRHEAAQCVNGVYRRVAIHRLCDACHPLDAHSAGVSVYSAAGDFDTPAARTAATLAAMKQIAEELCTATTPAPEMTVGTRQ